MVDLIREHFGALVLEAVVPALADVWAAERRLRPVTQYRPQSRVSDAVRRAAAALVAEGLV